MLSDKESVQLLELRTAADTGEITERGKEVLADLEKRNLPETNALERFAIGMGRGALDIYQGAKQLGMQGAEKIGLLDPGSAQAYTDEVNRDMAHYQRLAEAHPWSTGAGRFAGNVAAAPVPAVGATLPMRLATAAGTGAAIGGLEYSPEMSMAERGRTAGFGLLGALGGEAGGQWLGRRLAGTPGRVPTPVAGELLERGAPSAGRAAGVQALPPPMYSAGVTPEYQIPLTRGQQAGADGRRGLRAQQDEQRILHGAYGDPAQQELAAFEANQRARIGEAATEARRRVTGRERLSASEEMAEAGAGLTGRAEELWGDVDAAFTMARDMDASLPRADTDAMFARMRGSLDKFDMSTEQNNPLTYQILGRLEEFYPDVPEGVEVAAIDAMGLHALRREINDLRQGANVSSGDRRNLLTLRQVLDDEMLRAAQEGRLEGPPEGILALQEGIRLRADYGRLYGPRQSRSRSGRNRTDPAGQIIEDIIELDLGGDEIANRVFGRGKLGSTRNTGEVYRRVLEATGRDSDEFRMMQSAAMDRIRQSVLVPGTNDISPTKLRTEWRRLRDKEGDLMNVIFNDDQLAEIDTLVEEVYQTVYDPRAINPSRTAHMMERIFMQMGASMAGATAGGSVAGPAGAVGGAAAGAFATQKVKNALGRAFARRTYEPLRELPRVGSPVPPATGRGAAMETERQMYEEDIAP